MSAAADEDGNPVPPPPIENYQRFKPRCECGNWINKIGATCTDCQLKKEGHTWQPSE